MKYRLMIAGISSALCFSIFPIPFSIIGIIVGIYFMDDKKLYLGIWFMSISMIGLFTGLYFDRVIDLLMDNINPLTVLIGNGSLNDIDSINLLNNLNTQKNNILLIKGIISSVLIFINMIIFYWYNHKNNLLKETKLTVDHCQNF